MAGAGVVRVAARHLGWTTGRARHSWQHGAQLHVYGGRNQMIAVAALGLIIGLGVAASEDWIRAQPRRSWHLALSAIIVTVLSGQTWLTRKEAGQQITDLLS